MILLFSLASPQWGAATIPLERFPRKGTGRVGIWDPDGSETRSCQENRWLKWFRQMPTDQQSHHAKPIGRLAVGSVGRGSRIGPVSLSKPSHKIDIDGRSTKMDLAHDQ